MDADNQVSSNSPCSPCSAPALPLSPAAPSPPVSPFPSQPQSPPPPCSSKGFLDFFVPGGKVLQTKLVHAACTIYPWTPTLPPPVK